MLCRKKKQVPSKLLAKQKAGGGRGGFYSLLLIPPPAPLQGPLTRGSFVPAEPWTELFGSRPRLVKTAK